MRIIYFGTSQFAVPPLKALLAARAQFEVVAVVSQPDTRAGASPVSAAAREAGLTLLQPEKLKSGPFPEELAALKPDLFVVAAYGRIIPQALLALPTRGSVNLHPSLLPKYRGPSPIQAALANGDAETGTTLMVMDAEMDHGPLLETVRVPIAANDDYPSLEARLAGISAEMLVRDIGPYLDGTLQPQPQDHAAATLCRMIGRDDGRIDWSTQSATQIDRLRRAYTPWPGIYTVWQRNGAPMRLKLLDVTLTDAPADTPPGTGFVTADGLPAIAAVQGAVVLRSVQPEGKKPQDGKAFLNGYRDFAGARMENA